MNKIIAILLTLIIFSTQGKSQKDITVNELKKHISYMASDDKGGRKPGTKGCKDVAKYIKKEFEKSGLKLLGNNGFQYFDIVTNIKLGKNNYLKVGKFKAKTWEDNLPFPFSANGKLKAKVVFAGYGFNINTKDIRWNDYKDINVKGKWVMILRGDPELRNRKSKFIPYSSDRGKVMTAIDNGAAGVIMVSGKEFDEKDKLVKLTYGRGNAQMKIPVIHIKRNLATKILQYGRQKTVGFDALEKALVSDKKPNSFETNTTVKASVNLEYVKIKTQNVIAMLEGSDETLKKEYIVVGAHYDHLGMGGVDSGSRMPDTIAVHNGADDNASGVASVIELAEEFAKQKTKPKRSMIFMAFGAEEMGLLGSSFFTKEDLIDMKNIYAMINLDMVGRFNENEKILSISGTGTALEFDDILKRHESSSKLKFAKSPSGYGASDHSSFYISNIPVLFFNTGAHEDYHTPFDDVEKINFKGQKTVTEIIYKITSELASKKEKLTYKIAGSKRKARSHGRGFKVTLGIIPGYGDTSNKGLRIDGTRKGGPADNGGMKRGDVITAINGNKITNIYDYMERLGRLKKGQIITVDIMRKGSKKVLMIKL